MSSLSPVTYIQNILMASGYFVLFLAILMGKLRKFLPAILWCSLATCAFNLLYDTTLDYPWALGLALFIRLLPPFEACWLVAYHRREARLALVGFAFMLIYCCSNPRAATVWGWLTVRSIATVAMAFECTMIYAFNRWNPLQESVLYVNNLKMQTIWMLIHSLFTLTSSWYTETWSRRNTARWMYVLSVLLVILSYRNMLLKYSRMLNCPPAPSGSEAGGSGEGFQ